MPGVVFELLATVGDCMHVSTQAKQEIQVAINRGKFKQARKHSCEDGVRQLFLGVC